MSEAKPNRRILLRQRPIDLLSSDDYEITIQPPAPVDEGDALIETALLAMDPVTRVMLGADIKVMPPIPLGEAIRGFGVGQVVESRHAGFPVGARVMGFFEWADYQCVRTVPRIALLPDDVSFIQALNLYGHTAHAAYFGMIEVGKVAKGDVVVVTGAAGAVGSIAAQIARIKGARVIGTAGTSEKRAWLTDVIGLDAALDYRAGNIDDELTRLTPDGVDLIFDNVGGALLDRLIGHLAPGGRVVLCGAIAQYLDSDPLASTVDVAAIIERGGTASRFNAMDYATQFGDAFAQMMGWEQQGQLKVAVKLIADLEQAPAALNSLFRDRSQGRLLVDLSGMHPE